MIQLIKDFDEIGVSVKFLQDGISTEGQWEKWSSLYYQQWRKLKENEF